MSMCPVIFVKCISGRDDHIHILYIYISFATRKIRNNQLIPNNKLILIKFKINSFYIKAKINPN